MITKVYAENFLSWETLEFDVSSKITLIEGFNHDDGTPEGSGKSAIPNAVSWALFGKLPKDAKIDEVIREGEKSCMVQVVLLDGTSVIRSRKPNDLYLVRANSQEPIKGKDAKETQDMIEKLLGFSFETFCQAIYFAQNYPKKFITSTEEEKAKILSEIQDLEQFTEARKRAAALAKITEADLSLLERDNLSLRDSITELERELGNYQHLRTQFLEEKEATLSELSGQASRLKRELKELEAEVGAQNEAELSKEIRSGTSDAILFEEEISQLKEALGSLYAIREGQRKAKIELKEIIDNTTYEGYKQTPEDVEKDLKEISGKIEELIKEKAELSAQLTSQKDNELRALKLKTRIEKLHKEAQEAEAAVGKMPASKDMLCPTCGGIMGVEHARKHKQEQKDKLAALRSEIAELEEEAATVPKSDANEIREALNNLNETLAEFQEAQRNSTSFLKTLQKAQAQAQAQAKRIEQLEAYLAEKVEDPSELEAGISAAQSELKLLREKITEAQRQLASVQELNRRITRVTSDLNEVKQRIAKETEKEPTKLDENIERAVTKLNGKTEERNQILIQITEKKRHLYKLESLKSTYKEVKSYVFQGLLAELTRKSNRYLSELFEIPIQLRFSNTGDEGEISKIQVQVEIDGNDRPLGLYSGGQFRRIQLAVDLALSEIIAGRAGKPVNFRIFDEYMKDLSEVSMEKVLRLLEGLKGSTIVIEHNSLIKNVVNQTFRVELKDGVSRRVS